MSVTPDKKQPLSTLVRLPGPPTHPGWFWWTRDGQSTEIMVEVRLTNGELTVWWPNQDTSVAKLRGSWRGPIPPSTGPGNPTAT